MNMFKSKFFLANKNYFLRLMEIFLRRKKTFKSCFRNQRKVWSKPLSLVTSRQCKHPHRNKINQPATEGNSTERKRKVPKTDVAPKWQFSKRIPFLRMTDQWMYDFPWTILSGLICFCIPWLIESDFGKRESIWGRMECCRLIEFITNERRENQKWQWSQNDLHYHSEFN